MPHIYQLFLEHQRAIEGSTWSFRCPLTDMADQPIQYQRIHQATISLRSLEEVPQPVILTDVDVRGNSEHGEISADGSYLLTLQPAELGIMDRERDLPWFPKRRVTVHYVYDRQVVQNILIDFSIVPLNYRR